jgi:hypothetical protein
MKNIYLILAILITIASAIPYIKGILKGKTKPNIVSWITWTLLTGIATVAELAGHEYRTAIFTGTAVIETAIIVVLGLSRGYVKYTRFDYVCQFGAIVGLLLWWLFNSPAAGVIAAVSIDFIGALPTIRHSWNQPGEESWPTFAMGGAGGLLAILALTEHNWTSLTYPIYILIVNIIFVFSIIYRGITHPHFKPSDTSRLGK